MEELCGLISRMLQRGKYCSIQVTKIQVYFEVTEQCSSSTDDNLKMIVLCTRDWHFGQMPMPQFSKPLLAVTWYRKSLCGKNDTFSDIK